MSLSIVLIPTAIAVCITAVETVEVIKEKCRSQAKNEVNCGIQTKFNNTELLAKTLDEHGLDVVIYSHTQICANGAGGKLTYKRNNTEEAFELYIEDIEDVEGLICDIDALNNEYSMNVQEYTYEKVKCNLDSNMRLESEEVLDDNSILLTISIEE